MESERIGKPRRPHKSQPVIHDGPGYAAVGEARENSRIMKAENTPGFADSEQNAARPFEYFKAKSHPVAACTHFIRFHRAPGAIADRTQSLRERAPWPRRNRGVGLPRV
jgi:hypothetical protein